VNTETDNPQADGITRRRRKAPQRRVPTVINQPERKRFLFGLGGELNHREREAAKERIAFFFGIGLAVIVAAILGWGIIHDAVIQPYQTSQANAKPVAKIGSYTVSTGYFKRFVHFQSVQLQNTITQLQQQESQLTGNKKAAAQLAQVQSQLSVEQNALTTLPQDSLTQLINGQTALQRAKQAGVTVKKSEVDKAMLAVERSTGGKDYYQQFLKQGQLSDAELRQLVTSQLAEQKVQAKLSKTINPTTTKVRASHILVKSKSLAEKLLKEAEHGANFAALAKKYSTDKASAKLGGDLGYFAQHTMVAPFDAAAFSMKVGQIRLVHSTFGYHVIKVTGRERVKMTSTELTNAKQSVYSTWLAKQQAIIGVQKYIKTADLPGQNEIPTPSTATNPLQSLPQTQPQAPPVQVKPGKSTKTTKPKSTTKP
jgi:parvulin-like peptidyl-prolyl isomerase